MSHEEPLREPASARSHPRFLVARGHAVDLPACAALESLSFSAPWTEDMLREEVGASTLWLVARERPRATRDAVDAYALLRETPPDAELLRLAVDPRSRRRGAGAELLTAAIEELRSRGFERLWLEVRSDNAAALGLYRRLGFELVATRRRYYADGGDACVLTLTWFR